MSKSQREDGRKVAKLILARFGAELAYQPDAGFYRPARRPDPRAAAAPENAILHIGAKRAGRMARLEMMGQMRLEVEG
jgi:hypothetical protein